MQTFSCEIEVKDCTFIAEDVVINCFMKEKPRRTATARKEQQSQEPSLLKEAQLADPEIKLVRE